MTVDPWTGLSLHDVNFLGDRIAYEISVQDQFVAYSGYSSIGQAFYFDDSYQLGASSYQLRCDLQPLGFLAKFMKKVVFVTYEESGSWTFVKQVLPISVEPVA